jgi:N-acetylated-alpha-linked acidic dipeptidase
LDIEKAGAEAELKRILKKWKKRGPKFRRFIRRIIRRLKKIFKRHRKHRCHGKTPVDKADHVPPENGGELSAFKGRQSSRAQERRGSCQLQQAYGMALAASDENDTPWLRKFDLGNHKSGIREFIRAVKRVRAVNQKLVAFERGFISKDGIKDREWYKHLGVAPGKWLGWFILSG